MSHQDFVTPFPPPSEHVPEGKEEKLCGMDVYVNKPAGTTKAVVLCSDVFGWKKPPLRRFADKLADAGFMVVVPDFFMGDYIDSTGQPDAAAWFPRHPFDRVAKDTVAVIEALKDQGMKYVGAAGFCYGGKVAIMASVDLDAAVVLHPSKVTVEDIQALKCPLSILSAENDHATTVSLVEEYRKVLESQNEIQYQVKYFPDRGHGWTMRYDINDKEAVKSADEALMDALSWFKKYLSS